MNGLGSHGVPPRQRYPRVSLDARVVRYDGQPAEWRSLNVSEGGVFVRGTPLLAPGTELNIGLWLPTPTDAVEVVGRARVVWANDPDDPESHPDVPLGMGMELIDLAPDDRALLKEHLYTGRELLPDLEDTALLAVGTTIGSYQVLDFLGSGGMGNVYLAEHVRLGRRVALKRLHDRYLDDPVAIRRFFDEGRLVNRVAHPNVLEITDFVAEPRDKCYVMELLDGPTLADILKTKELLPLPRLLHVAAQICDGLQAIHEAGVVHRDLKPGNIILLSRPGGPNVVKLVDFGIAKLLGEPDDRIENHKTAPGLLVGTPYYMSPEQALGHPVDTRSDLYSFGVLLYQLLTGTVVFTADTWTQVLIQHATAKPAPPSQLRREIPRALERLVLQCLEKKPAQRPQSAGEIAQRLRSLARDDAYDGSSPGQLLPPQGSSGAHEAATRPFPHTGHRRHQVPRASWITSPGTLGWLTAMLLASVLAFSTLVTGASPVDVPSPGSPLGSELAAPASTNPAVITSSSGDATVPPPDSAPKGSDPEGITRAADRKPGAVEDKSETSSTGRSAKKRKRGKTKERVVATRNVEEELARATRLIRAGYTRQALRVAHDILREDASNGRAYRLLGIGYTLVGNTRLACESYRRYLLNTPEAPDRDKVESLLQSCSR